MGNEERGRKAGVEVGHYLYNEMGFEFGSQGGNVFERRRGKF